MKKTVTISLIYLFSLGFMNNLMGQCLLNQQKSKIEAQIDSIFHVMIKAAENLEYDKLSQGVDDTNNAGFITNGSYYARYDSLINIMKTKAQGLKKQSITIHQEKITVLSESIALLTAKGDAIIEVNNGNTFTIKFFWSFVYEKINNNWKVIQSHQSSVRL